MATGAAGKRGSSRLSRFGARVDMVRCSVDYGSSASDPSPDTSSLTPQHDRRDGEAGLDRHLGVGVGSGVVGRLLGSGFRRKGGRGRWGDAGVGAQ